MDGIVGIPCIVAAKVLWRSRYAPTLINVAPNMQKLVWAEKKDLILETQSPTAEELSATLSARIVREEADAVIVSVRTQGTTTELVISKEVLKKFSLSA